MSPVRMAAGMLALTASSALLVIALVRGAVNPLTIWTIVLADVGGVILVKGRSAPSAVGSAVILALAAVPAMIGGLGLLLVPSIVLALVAATRVRRSA